MNIIAKNLKGMGKSLSYLLAGVIALCFAQSVSAAKIKEALYSVSDGNIGSAHKARLMHSFEISYEKDAFLLDGKPIQIRCGEMHFARVPRAYWRHRIKMCKAMGLNAICAYMFWNYHEMERGKYDFSGEKDIAEFCRIAQEEGMWVLLRPGPYTCAEWEFGGLPWWLLENGADKVKVRTRDIAYLKPSIAYMRRVADELRELQVTRGGPILMCQVENEYGSFGNDAELIRAYYKTMREAGFDIPIFTCNGAARLRDGDIPEVYKAVNFGSRPRHRLADLRKVQPKGPLMCGEYYPAWFDSWGTRHHTKPMKALLGDIGYMLSAGASFSIYMAHGGTTFGWWAGCNTPFHPQTSSYDYDAPISEQGRTTPKFFALRNLMKKHMTSEELQQLPEPPEPIPLQAFTSDAEAELVVPAREKRLGGEMAKPLAMEMLGQGYGAIVYAAKLGGKGGYLKVSNLRDQAAVFADGEFCGFLDRRYANRGVAIPEGRKCLRIVVTHMSRYNFGKAMGNTAKGLFAPVMLGGKEITGWTASAVTPDCIAFMKPSRRKNGPCTFKRFKVSCNSTADTFLLVRGWKKGHVWVNGRPLGRFWGIGPTQTMYVPGCWLKKGVNEFLVWDFGGNVPMKGLEFVDKPVLDELHPECDFMGAFKRESAPYQPPENPTMRGEFPNTSDLQTVKLPKTARGRRFAFVIDSAWENQKDKKDMASIAEFDIIDAKGEVVPRGAWRFVSVSSEETAKEDGLAENAIDGQSVNYWHTRWSKNVPKAPHYLVIDMGAQVDVAGFRYLPRQDMTNGRVRAWRFDVE